MNRRTLNWTLIAVAEPFMILAGCQRKDMTPIRHDDKAGFNAMKKFFDNNFTSRVAEVFFNHDRIDCRMRFFR